MTGGYTKIFLQQFSSDLRIESRGPDQLSRIWRQTLKVVDNFFRKRSLDINYVAIGGDRVTDSESFSRIFFSPAPLLLQGTVLSGYFTPTTIEFQEDNDIKKA